MGKSRICWNCKTVAQHNDDTCDVCNADLTQPGSEVAAYPQHQAAIEREAAHKAALAAQQAPAAIPAPAPAPVYNPSTHDPQAALFAAMVPDPVMAARLEATVVTPGDVYAYLAHITAAYTQAYGSPPPVAVEMFGPSPDDLATYKQAYEWWPKMAEVPESAKAPSIVTLCQWYWEPQQGATFMQRLINRSNIAVGWLQQQGIDVANPNEGEEERKKRLGRERATRHRTAHSDPDRSEKIKAAAQALADTRAQAKTVLAELQAEVTRRYDLMMEASSKHKETKAYWDGEIKRLNEEHKALMRGAPVG